MRNGLRSFGIYCLLAAILAGAASTALAAPDERYLHIKVEDSSKGESVHVNLPLSMAEKILPTVDSGSLRNGHVTIGKTDLKDLDVRAILDAIRTTQDNEFVTVKEKDQDVRVAKSKGNLVVHVRDSGPDGQKIDVSVPMKVVDALLSTAKQNELDIAAAVRALSDAGDELLVTVQGASEHVRIWVDSRNTAE
ncbi:MAG: hypothetical protein WB630_17780 [Candidatus Acidiferrales bacterium]